MKNMSTLAGYGVAVCVVVGVALSLHTTAERGADSPVPSIDNPSARGAKALWQYLDETGAAPKALRGHFMAIPGDAKVLVSLAPTARPYTGREWRVVRAWVQKGGTFVYAVPRRVRTQYLETGLSLRWVFGPRPAPLLELSRLDDELRGLLERRQRREQRDPSGTDAQPWLEHPLLAGVERLRVAADDGLDTEIPQARMVAGAAAAPFVLSFPEGQGEFVVLAGSDLAENRRIALGDNLRFWANLAARGQVYFDEYHHVAPAGSGRGLVAALGPTVLQLLLVALVLGAALVRRLGEPRPLREAAHRSQGEYVRQLAGLYEAGRLEAALCHELYASLRRTLSERLGLGTTLDDRAIAQRLRQRSGIDPDRYLALVRRSQELARGATPEQFARLSKEFAELERQL